MTNVDGLGGSTGGRSFDEFYRQHYNAVLRYAERRIDSGTAADVCIECFAIAWKKFDPERPFGVSWLYRTAHHLLGNKYRKRARDKRLVDRLQREAENATEAVSGDQSDLLVALEQLSPIEQEVLRLTYWEMLSAAEIAVVLRVSEQAVWKRVSRAKSKLRARVEAQNIATPTRKGEANA